MKHKTLRNKTWRRFVAAFAIMTLLTGGGKSGNDAVSALRKQRDASLERASNNNILQLVAVADQYYLETGKTSASFTDIVGPTKYSKQIDIVDGETYPTSFKKGEPIVVKLKDGRTLRQNP